VSATTEPTAGVIAAAATTKSSSTTAVVPSRPCYWTERHGCDANYQSNYFFYFHAFKFDPRFVCWRLAVREILRCY
jgi:hypothetical protein